MRWLRLFLEIIIIYNDLIVNRMSKALNHKIILTNFST